MNFIIFPNQIFEKINVLKPFSKIYLIEHESFFGFRDIKMNFNQKKILLHRASFTFYRDYLKQKLSAKIIYLPFTKKDFLQGIKGKVVYYNPVDYYLQSLIDKQLKKYKLDGEMIETLNFMTSEEELKNYYETVKNKKKPFFQTSFYKFQRERLNLLMVNGKPEGGRLTFDDENRKPLPKGINIPEVKPPKENILEAQKYVLKHFSKNIGNVENFWCPITFASAKSFLQEFLKERFSNFGKYQDAILMGGSPFLFHSGISSSINIGLLDPLDVVHEVIKYGKEHQIGLNNIEAFIRQIVGWREFSRYTYLYLYQEMTTTNYFQAQHKLNQNWYLGETGVLPLDDCIKKAFDNGYLHHIERLMIMSSFMMMIGIYPRDVYQWFMEFAVDSYDWVMVNNVYSMGLYSDGGLTTSKAYAASSNYEMLKRSNYPKESYQKIWDAAYWTFIGRNRDKMRKMGRFGPIQVKNWERKTAEKKREFEKEVKDFLKKN